MKITPSSHSWPSTFLSWPPLASSWSSEGMSLFLRQQLVVQSSHTDHQILVVLTKTMLVQQQSLTAKTILFLQQRKKTQKGTKCPKNTSKLKIWSLPDAQKVILWWILRIGEFRLFPQYGKTTFYLCDLHEISVELTNITEGLLTLTLGRGHHLK